MKILKLISLSLFFFKIGFSQDKMIVSDLDNLTLNLGEIFKPVSKVILSDGSTGDCMNIIYYNKKGVFSSAKSITFDRSEGTLKANEPGTHEIVAVCIDSQGRRLSKTFNVNVNYPKIKEIKLSINDENIYIGNYVKLIYEITDELDNKRMVDYWNYENASKYFSKVGVTLSSSNKKVKIDESNNILAAEEGKTSIVVFFDGVSAKIDLEIKKNPVAKLDLISDAFNARSGDVINFSATAYDKKNNKLENIPFEFSFTGKSFDKSNSASGLILEDGRFVGDSAEKYWMGTSSKEATPGVDLYVGGTEHAVLHLLYARFWHKALFDLGYVSSPEPFYKLVNQGLILGEDGQKMSKSRGNVVNPDEILEEFGADALRLYEMFMGPLEMVKPWNTKGVEGVYRFLGRVWRMFIDEQTEKKFEQQFTLSPKKGLELLSEVKFSDAVADIDPTQEQMKVLHTCIKKVTEDMEHLRFNTAISALMVFVNEVSTWDLRPLSVLKDFLLLLSPFAPHIAEELYSKANNKNGSSIAYYPWPNFDEKYLVETSIEMVVQVNGKVRDRLQVPAEIDNSKIEELAMNSENVKRHIEGKKVKKVIVIPGKLINIVAI